MSENYGSERPIGLSKTISELRDRFRYHKPGEAVEKLHERVRDSLYSVAMEMDKILPPGREASIVQTKLEEAMFWANAAIARNQK